MFLTIVTQRPYDVSNTILSQCHNYIIHKLVNPNDVFKIKNAVFFIDEQSFKMITSLSQGQAILSVTAIKVPTLIKVDSCKIST